MTSDEIFENMRTKRGHPDPAPFPAKFAQSVVANDMLYLAGEGPRWGSEIKFRGSVWNDLSEGDAREAAEITTMNLLWHTQQAIQSLENVRRVVEVIGFVRSTPEFGQQPAILDACSAMLLKVFGSEKGPHARCAIGVTALPLNICVEIRMVMHVSSK